jgi:hypothetical protein
MVAEWDLLEGKLRSSADGIHLIVDFLGYLENMG